MTTSIEADRSLSMELWAWRDGKAAPVHREGIANDLPDLFEEAFVRAVLAEGFPNDPGEVRGSIQAICEVEPFVDHLEIALEARSSGRVARVRQRFESGRWSRRAQGIADELRAGGTIGNDDRACVLVTADPPRGGQRIECPPLRPVLVSKGSLADCGVARLREGALDPDRPILVNESIVRDGIRLCREAGTMEAGAAVLGRIVELPEPIDGTRTPIVTVLSAMIADSRHAGSVGAVTFSPEALVSADEIADLRGMGELVQTVLHTHGWGTGCDECNGKDSCPLPECTQVSDKDYTVMETLFPCKAAVMPIVGRRRGAERSGPVLAIHGWCGGELRCLPWRAYED